MKKAFRSSLAGLVLAVAGCGGVWAQERAPVTAAVQQILDRALAVRETGDAAGELAVLEAGIATLGPEAAESFLLYQRLGEYYADRGNVFNAIQVAERQGKVAKLPGQEFLVRVKLASLYPNIFQMDKASQALASLQALMPRLRASPGWARQGDYWQAGVAWANATYLSRAGHLKDAEVGWRTCLSFAEKQLATTPEHGGAQFYLADCTAGLLGSLVAAGKLAEAGAVIAQQQPEIERIAARLQRPALLYRVALPAGRVILEQGRLRDARAVFEKLLLDISAAGGAETSMRVAVVRLNLALIEMLEDRWPQALARFDERAAALRKAGEQRGNLGDYPPEYAYTLLRVGRPAEALALMRRIVKRRQELFDEQSLMLWEARAFLGAALAANGDKAEALAELRVAIPKVLELANGERSAPEGGVLRTARLGWMLDGYLMLLGELAADANSPQRAFALDESFRMADVARGSVVQRALAIAASRASIRNPALAELAGQEQDLQRQIGQLADGLVNLLSRGRVQEQDAVVADMRNHLITLRKRHAEVAQQLARRFPDYASLIDPRPVGIDAAQAALKPGEAMVSVYPGSTRTLVWALAAGRPPAFALAPANAAEVADAVRSLRRTLDPQAINGDSLPPFDTGRSHALYTQLLQPVAAVWSAARELIVVPHGKLAQLPFATLLTAPWPGGRGSLPHAELAQAPWLLRQLAVSQMPSVVAFAALRSAPAPAPAPRPFIGIGDPVFNLAGATAPSRGIVRRNLNLRPAAVDAENRINFDLLPQLPDTALELREIAKVLAADGERDVLLQKGATERSVKEAELSAYRVVMFATHGLMSGEMPGLYQPALALSNPQLTGDREDGMLTMEEILGLKLKADWVVLSACNTAAADSNLGGAESFSGLGRAFFFAGARALLATSWAVETESARLLTTDVFRRQLVQPQVSRAVALQQAALGLMQKSAGKDYSYAHPLFWAPFVLVGDGS